MLINLGRAMSPAQGGEAMSVPSASLSDVPFLWAAFDPNDSVANTPAIYSKTFAPSAVDTADNTIDFGEDIDFGNPAAGSGKTDPNQGTLVYLSTTDTLPGGTATVTPYFLRHHTGTKYKLHHLATDSDRASLSRRAMSETIFPAHGLIQNELEVDLTSQGAGTHTLYTDPLLEELTDSLNGYRIISKATRNSFMEVLTDGDGHKYVKQQPMIADLDVSDDFYGKGWLFGRNEDTVAMKAHISAKKTLLRACVADFEYVNILGEKRYVINTATGVNTSTDIITSANAMTSEAITGSKCELYPDLTATLPTGTSAATVYYWRRISGTTGTLHPTKADADANTNIVNLTGTGSGKFSLIFTEIVGTRNPWGFTNEMEEASNAKEALVVGSDVGAGFNIGVYNLVSSSIVYKSGSFNGRWHELDKVPDYARVYVWFPRDAVLIRNDTAAQMESGYYYVGGGSGSCKYALYDDLAAAQDDGANNRNTNTAGAQCIKFDGTAGVGSCKLVQLDATDQYLGIDGNSQSTGEFAQIPFGKHLHTWVGRYNDPAASFMEIDYYLDGVFQATFVTSRTKRDTATTNANTTNIGTWMNSDQPHVPPAVKLYADYYGASDDATLDSDDLDLFHDIVMAAFGLN